MKEIEFTADEYKFIKLSMKKNSFYGIQKHGDIGLSVYLESQDGSKIEIWTNINWASLIFWHKSPLSHCNWVEILPGSLVNQAKPSFWRRVFRIPEKAPPQQSIAKLQEELEAIKIQSDIKAEIYEPEQKP